MANKIDAINKQIIEKLDCNNDGKVDIQDIISLALKTPGICIKRADFLRKELYKNHTEEEIQKAISTTPAKAGIPKEEIDKIADEVIKFERISVSGISTALGAPGGWAMAATIPADLVQYYGFTLRAVQKLLYLYGFPELFENEDGLHLDTETVNEIIICLGIMNGVSGANNAIKAMAKALGNGVNKKLLNMALTKGSVYPIVKAIAKWFDVKLTTKIFSDACGYIIPVVGGFVGGGITFFAFKPCCERLKNCLQDTKLSNPDHVETQEETDFYNAIVNDEVVSVEESEIEVIDE